MSDASGKSPIYLDYCATTPVDERVVQAMLPFFSQRFGNAASTSHAHGRDAAREVDLARCSVANLVGCNDSDIVWTSGATEANNLALRGTLKAVGTGKRHVVVQATEHKAVLDPCKSLAHDDYEITVIGVDCNGLVDPGEVEHAIRADTAMVSIMWANNEIGTIMPVEAIARICDRMNVVFHTDATQAVGKLAIDLSSNRIDLLSLSAHKFYGPKGVGALVFRRGPKLRRLRPIIEGGGHERGLRSGTLNVPGIVGIGEASRIAKGCLAEEYRSVSALRDLFENAVASRLPGVQVNAKGAPRLPNVSNLVFEGVDAESLLIALDRVSASTGSACTSASIEPSHVLRAIGIPDAWQRSSVRFSFGRQTTVEEAEVAVDEIVRITGALRDLSTAAL